MVKVGLALLKVGGTHISVKVQPRTSRRGNRLNTQGLPELLQQQRELPPGQQRQHRRVRQ